ncbi:MAG: hypothetical protein JRJ87_05265 [Deltaproteobacteria bacterium]|nr:hypothetical protein [Deltaproteobacteria bacterium]
MNGKNIKIVVALLAGLTFGITGCTGDQVSPDRVYLDADGNSNGDGPRLCQSVADCLAGEDCQDGVCVSATSCNCNYDCDKTANEVCNQATHECETGAPPVNCLTDCDCYTGEGCISGTCQPTGGDERTCTIDGRGGLPHLPGRRMHRPSPGLPGQRSLLRRVLLQLRNLCA